MLASQSIIVYRSVLEQQQDEALQQLVTQFPVATLVFPIIVLAIVLYRFSCPLR